MPKDENTGLGPLRARAPEAITKAIIDFISSIPRTAERRSSEPGKRARVIARSAAAKASVLSGTLTLPPGPLGVLTVLPELVGVWRVQAQMVADIAGCYGQAALLTQEQMLYCLFKHAAAQAVRDLVVRVGERLLVRRAAVGALQSVARRLGVKVSQRFITQSVSRWLPVLGPVGVAAYAFYDTSQVANTAIALFEQELG